MRFFFLLFTIFLSLSVLPALAALESTSEPVAMLGQQTALIWPVQIVEEAVAEWEPYGLDVEAGYGPTIPARASRIYGGPRIRLQQAAFDPLLSSTPRHAGLAEPGQSKYYLIQFHGPIRSEWIQELNRRGVEIMDYVPDFAFIVRIPEQSLERLQTFPAVRWSGRFESLFRVHQSLLDQLQFGDVDRDVQIIARLFPGETMDELLASVASHVIEWQGVGADTGGGRLLRMTVPLAMVGRLAGVDAVAWIEPFATPELANSVARSNTILRKDQIESQLGLYGEGQVVAVTDSGLSTGNASTIHQDFAGRVLVGGWGAGGSCSGWEDNNSHGTHVAGSVLGSGVRSGANPGASQYAGSHAGIAPKASLAVWSNCEDFSGIPFQDPYGMFWQVLRDFNQNLRVNNNSWGQNNADGQYNSFARETDRFIWDFPDMVAVFAAGNQGRDLNADGVSDFTTIAPPSTAKNVIAVGGSENLRLSGGMNPGAGCSTYGTCWPQDYPVNPIASDRVSDNINGMYAASGRGPTLSNRLKPDIIAPATNIVSARNESVGMGDGIYNNFYIYMGGTSMASPLVSGGAALVREYFQRFFGHNPSAALVKGVLINGAVDMTPGQYGGGSAADVWRRPDINQGWGRMDLSRSLVFGNGRFPAYFEFTTGLATGQVVQDVFQIANPGQLLRVTLVWTDRAGLEASHGALVNDLDLELVAPNGTTHFGFAGLVGQQRDRFNNFEEVELPTAAVGQYTFRVRGFNVPQGPQPFALVITGALDVPTDQIHQDRFEG